MIHYFFLALLSFGVAMKKYVLKRVITAIFTLLAITLILFILMQLMPGSPFNDEKLNESQRAALYAKYGLDKPIVIQFLHYVINMFKGDLGVTRFPRILLSHSSSHQDFLYQSVLDLLQYLSGRL